MGRFYETEKSASKTRYLPVIIKFIFIADFWISKKKERENPIYNRLEVEITSFELNFL